MIVSIIIGLLIFFAALAWFLNRIADMDEECRVCNGSGLSTTDDWCRECHGRGFKAKYQPPDQGE